MNHDEDAHATGGGELVPNEPERDAGTEGRSHHVRETELRQIIELERKRIDRDNQQTEVQLRALEIADAQDERQFRFHSDRQRREEAAERQRFEFARSLAWGAFGLVAIVVVVTLWMAFFGDETQRSVASSLAKFGLVGLAGFGILSGLLRFLRALMKG